MARLGTTISQLLLLALTFCSPAAADMHMGIEPGEFQSRRQAAMNVAPGGIILVHSLSAPKDWNEAGFKQDSNFYYLTGLENLHDAILALDGTTKETWLFVLAPDARQQRLFAPLTGWDSVYLSPGRQTEQLLGIDHVVSWDGFSNFIDAHRKANPKLVLFVDQGGEGKMVADVSNPPGLTPIENPFVLWPAAIRAKWSEAIIADAAPALLKLRAAKSPAELALMRKSAAFTDAGFRAAMATTAPGRTQRAIEGAAVEAALRAGADEISIWPEVRSGPGTGAIIYQKAYDYHLMNRRMQAGETLLMDIGFSYENYRGDVGRTVPVSGHFTAEQREVIALMDGAYQAALRAMHDGVTADEVVQAGIRYVEDHEQRLHSDLAKKAAAKLLIPDIWIMYTHGLDMVEIFPVKELHTGYTVAFGPDFYANGQGFYEEDVVLVTKDGHELVNPALPYTTKDIETLMAHLQQTKKH